MSQEISPSEAERQLTAAIERHREVSSALDTGGGSDQARNAAVRSLARAMELVSYTLARAAAVGVGEERLAELSGWDVALVGALVAHGPDAAVVGRLTPSDVDTGAVLRATAEFRATARVEAVLQRILADVEHTPAPAADLEELADRLENTWRAWREASPAG